MIGSAVFNITLVIGACSILAPQVNASFKARPLILRVRTAQYIEFMILYLLHLKVFILNWWSVVRDCTCYLISIAILGRKKEDRNLLTCK